MQLTCGLPLGNKLVKSNLYENFLYNKYIQKIENLINTITNYKSCL